MLRPRKLRTIQRLFQVLSSISQGDLDPKNPAPLPLLLCTSTLVPQTMQKAAGEETDPDVGALSSGTVRYEGWRLVNGVHVESVDTVNMQPQFCKTKLALCFGLSLLRGSYSNR